MKILVVDDDKDFTKKQCEWLREERYDAVGVNSGKEAMDYLVENAADINLALVDMYMEARDSGLCIIKLIRENYSWIVPIVFTAHADLKNAARCMEEGCFSYIVKAETPADMIRQTIRKALDHQRYQIVMAKLESGRLDDGLKKLRGNFAELAEMLNQISCSLQRVEDEFSLLNIQVRDTTSS